MRHSITTANHAASTCMSLPCSPVLAIRFINHGSRGLLRHFVQAAGLIALSSRAMVLVSRLAGWPEFRGRVPSRCCDCVRSGFFPSSNYAARFGSWGHACNSNARFRLNRKIDSKFAPAIIRTVSSTKAITPIAPAPTEDQARRRGIRRSRNADRRT